MRAEPAKPGLCPRKRAQRSAAACPNRCTDDRDCPGDRKCCFSGCGLSCAPPGTGSRRAAVKPGACPVALRGSLGPCLELCDTDGDCPGAAKCCTTGCGHICKPPTEGQGLPPRPEVLPAGLWPGMRHPAAGHSLALARKGCTRSCCFGATPHPTATAPLWVSKEVLPPAVPTGPRARPCAGPSAPPARWHWHCSNGPGRDPQHAQPLPAVPSRSARRPQHPTPGQGSRQPRHRGKPLHPYRPQLLHSTETE
ncbi:uncharacterized protein M6G45_011497 [Spheniscus humboldti]